MQHLYFFLMHFVLITFTDIAENPRIPKQIARAIPACFPTSKPSCAFTLSCAAADERSDAMMRTSDALDDHIIEDRLEHGPIQLGYSATVLVEYVV